MANTLNCTKGNAEYFRTSRTIGYDLFGKPIRKDFYGTGKGDANNKAIEYMENIKKGLNLELANQPLFTAVRTWLFEVKRMNSSSKPTTFSRYETSFRNMLLEKENLAAMKVKDIKSLHIQKYINSKATTEDKTYSQIKNFLKVIKMFFKYATEEGYTLKNPTLNLNNPGKIMHVEINDDDDDNDEWLNYETFSEEEIVKIKLEMERCNYRMRFLILLALETGMRKGELLGLKYTDIKNGKIKISRMLKSATIVNADGTLTTKNVIWDPKTKSSKRTISFPKNLNDELSLHKKRQMEEHLLLNIDENLVFIFESKLGNNLDPKNFYDSYIALIKRAGVKRKKFHTFRDTFATRHVRIGTPLPVLMQLLGHSDIDTTMKYVHIENNDTEKAMDNYEAAYS